MKYAVSLLLLAAACWLGYGWMQEREAKAEVGDQVAVAEAKAKSIAAEKAAVEEQVAALEAKISELAAAGEALQAEVAAREEHLAEKDAALAEMGGKLAALQARIDELEGYREQISQVRRAPAAP